MPVSGTQADFVLFAKGRAPEGISAYRLRELQTGMCPFDEDQGHRLYDLMEKQGLGDLQILSCAQGLAIPMLQIQNLPQGRSVWGIDDMVQGLDLTVARAVVAPIFAPRSEERRLNAPFASAAMGQRNISFPNVQPQFMSAARMSVPRGTPSRHYGQALTA